MILITGSNGKIGSSLVKFLKKKKNYKFIATIRSRNYRLINNSCVGLNLLNENHIKKLFRSYKFEHLIHLAVTRNPLYIKQIRNYESLIKDTLMMINILKYCGNLKSIIFTSSIAIYKFPELKGFVKREIIVKKILNFLKKKNKGKIKIKTIPEKRKKDLIVNPLFHKKANKRLNGTNKLINELLLSSFCFEKKISLFILRPIYVIESKREKDDLAKKIKLAIQNKR